MKKTTVLLAIILSTSVLVSGQTNKDKLALAINKADDANMEKLKAYVWKRKSVVSVDGQVKLTTVTEFSFDSQGNLQAHTVDTQSNIERKAGTEGEKQQKNIEEKADYVEEALGLTLAYAFMSKGELVDFFSKATVSEMDGTIKATADNVHIKGDNLTVLIDSKTNLFIKKMFSSFMGKDPVSGEINYEKFSSGVSHGSTTVINMPVKKMKINSTNQDYTIRVK